MAAENKKTRNHVSWKLTDLKEFDEINEWLNCQDNIQLSLTNIVLHMIDCFGNRNITDRDIQRMLYSMPSKKDYLDDNSSLQSTSLALEQSVQNTNIQKHSPSNSKDLTTTATFPVDDENNPYGKVDKDLL